jgi:hypothetical protein
MTNHYRPEKQNMFYLILTMCFALNINAQSTLVDHGHPSRSGANTASVELSRVNDSNIAVYESKINTQLIEIRTLLSDPKVEKHFKEAIGPAVIVKSESICPSIPLKSMMLGTDNFLVDQKTNYDHVEQAYRLLNIILTELNKL